MREQVSTSQLHIFIILNRRVSFIIEPNLRVCGQSSLPNALLYTSIYILALCIATIAQQVHRKKSLYLKHRISASTTTVCWAQRRALSQGAKGWHRQRRRPRGAYTTIYILSLGARLAIYESRTFTNSTTKTPNRIAGDRRRTKSNQYPNPTTTHHQHQSPSPPRDPRLGCMYGKNPRSPFSITARSANSYAKRRLIPSQRVPQNTHVWMMVRAVSMREYVYIHRI